MSNEDATIEEIRRESGFFDDKGHFKVKKMALKIMGKYKFKTLRDGERLFIYRDGYYHENGETFIKEAINAMLTNAAKTYYINETTDFIKSFTYDDAVESDNQLINIRNGIYNIETCELIPHDPSRFMVVQLPITYNKEAECPAIKKFISEIVADNDIKLVQELIGYCLLKNYHIQKAFMFIGEGANGKSTLLSLIRAFLGSKNISCVPLQSLDKNRFASGELFGKLANIYPDLTSHSLDETGTFKALTGGDRIMADQKFKQPFDFVNFAKLIFSCNKIPEVHDDTGAFFRRWVFINFPNKFEGEQSDTKIIDKLTIEEELSGLFNWTIEGLKVLLARGAFSDGKSTEAIKEQYERLSSPIMAFIQDCAIEDSEEFVTKARLYSKFIEYCQVENLPTMANNAFARKLKEHIAHIGEERKKVKGKQLPCWVGIGLSIDTKPENKKEGGIAKFV